MVVVVVVERGVEARKEREWADLLKQIPTLMLLVWGGGGKKKERKQNFRQFFESKRNYCVGDIYKSKKGIKKWGKWGLFPPFLLL